MLMSLFKWEARILNKLYKTERYDKLIQMQLNSPEQINYQTFFQITPDVQISSHSKIIEASNKLCRPSTRALQMQQFVAYLDQYMKKINQQSQIQKSIKDRELQRGNKNNYRLEHVVVYSCLSKCRIWPKVLKSGIGFVPNLITFYNSFTKQYSDWLDFKFDPVILTQKYTKIMKKAHMKKKDNPKLIQAIKNNDIQCIKNILNSIKHKYKEQTQKKQNKNQIQTYIQQKQQFAEIINNIWHKGLAVSHICAQYSNIEVIKYLASLGTDFQLPDDQKQTAIFYTIKRADLSIVNFFVQQLKVNLNHREYQDRTVFYLAAFQGELQIVDYLYKNGADPQLCSKLDRTPLSKACYLGNTSVVKYLLGIKVDILKQDNKGRTALHNAVWGIEGGRDGKRRGHIMLQDSPECAKLLIQAGHPIDFQDYDGFTPFFSAVSSRAIRSMRLLINLKANIYHKTKNQQTAVFIAAKYGHVTAMKILVQQLDFSFLQPDYHGYTPLCASFTLEQPQTCSYLLNLYMKNGLLMQVQKIVECCKHYQTVKNINFIRHWLKENENNNVVHMQKIIYLSQNLPLIIKTFIKLKKQKRQIKQSIQLLKKSLAQKYLIENQTTLQNKKKIDQQKYKLFENFITNKIEQQQFTQDQEKQIPKIQQKNKQAPKHKQKQAIFQTKNNINKQLTAIKNLGNFILQIAVQIVKQLQLYIKSQLNLKSLQNNIEQNINNLRLKYIKKYSKQQYKQVIIIILSEYVHAFNKGKHCFDDIVQGILELAKILDSRNPTIPPNILPQYINKDNKQIFVGSLLSEYLYYINEQQVKVNYLSHKQTQKVQLINSQYQNHKLQFLKQKHILTHNLCKIKLHHHQNQSQLLKLITNNQVVTNLIQNEEELLHSLFKLAKFRQTGVIIGIFNRGQNIGNISYQRLVDIVIGRLMPNVNSHEMSKRLKNKSNQTQSLQQKDLTLIQYCVLNGISDIAVFLQQICKSPQTPLLVEIPKYQIQRINLLPEQIKVQLQIIEEWTFNLKQIFNRMNEKQRNVYQKFININKIFNKVEENQQSIQNNKSANKQFEKFQTCHNYHIIDTRKKLVWLQKVLNQSILIGIDVEHYNVTKQEYFICSVQISNGEGVYILDTLSHLKNIKDNVEQQKIMKQEFRQQSLNLQLISNFIRKLMNDKTKIKIFHAYENDVKWLHEDFNLKQTFVDSNQKIIGQASRVQNVVDTCKIYGLLHKTKKSQSVGLRTLCQKYIGYKMDKSFQRSDWRIRPLFNQMIQYAAIDAEVLPYVYLRMLQSESQCRIKQKFKSSFCIKRQISGRGIRNKLMSDISTVQQLK